MDSISDLLEISGEDDSLLSGGNSSTSANIFSCSPLVSIRSRPLQTTQPAKGIEITSVVSEDLTSSPKVCQQSQQKKRKKKFGGFNLRKSLAWDRAFFTEQGVLNPTELSMISGTATPNSKSKLEVIDEEELATTSIALQQIEENLFKHSSGGVSIRAKKIGAVSGLSPKPDASVKRTPPVASLAKRKVLATNNVGNKYKRSAIPRAVSSSSTDTTKTPSRESKVTRIPGPKSYVSANATTSRSGMLSSSSSKRNQNAHLGLSKNPTPSIPSLSKNPTPSIPHLSKNPTQSISSLSKNPTYVPSLPKVDMADKCSVSRTLTKQAGKLSVNPQDNPVSVLRPPSRMDQTMHQTGTIKSSGLRKPSPSIGFFSQAKASGSHSLQKSSIPCKPSESNIPKLKKLETVSVKQARSKVVKGAAKNTKELSLSDVKSEAIVQIDKKQTASVEVDCDSSRFEIISKQAEVENILDDVSLKSNVQGALHENEIISSMKNMALPTHEKEFLTKNTKELSLSDVKSEAIVQIDKKQMVGVEVDYDSSRFEIISKQAEVGNILDDVIIKSKEQGGLHENEIISSMENMVLPTHRKEFLKKSQTHEQLEKEADHALDNKLYDASSNGDWSLYQEPDSTLCPIMQGTSNTVQNVIGQDDDDQIKGLTSDIPTFKESLILQEEHRTSFKDGRHSGEFKGCSGVKTALLNSSLDDFGKTVQKGSKQGSPCKKVNCGADEFGRYEGDAQGHLLNESLTINCKKPTQSNLEAVSQQLQADQLKTQNPSGVEEIGPEKENISDMYGSQPVHVSTLFSKVSPEKSILGINVASEDESKIIEIKDCQLPVDDQSGFIPRSPMDKECDQVIDSKAIHDRTPEFEFDRVSEDCMTVSATACCINVTPEKKPFLENNVKNLHLTPPTVKAAFDSVGNNMPINDSGLMSEPQIRDDNFSTEKIEELHEEGAQAQSVDESPLAYDCSSKVCLANVNDQFSLADDTNINEDSHLPRFQKPSAVVPANSQDVHLDSDILPTVIVLSTEIKDQNLVEDAFEGCGFHSNEHNASNHHTEDMPVNVDGNHDVDGKAELMQINGAKDDSSNILPLVEIQLDDNEIYAPYDSSIEASEDPFTIVVALKSKEQCLLIENSKLLDSDMTVSKDGNHDMDEKVEHLQINNVEDGNRDVDEKVKILQINDVAEKVELLQINDVNEEVELLQINDVEEGNHDVDEKVELLQINGAEHGNHDVDEKVELLQINDVGDENLDVEEKVELLQINGAEDGNRDVDEKVELLQINGAEDGNRDVDEKVELLQINYVDENMELLQINDVDEKVEHLQINDVEDGNHDVVEKVEHLQISDVEDGNHDVDEKAELLQISGAEDGNRDVDEKVELLQINDAEDGNCDVDEKVELLQINGAEDGNRDVDEKVEILQINSVEDGKRDVDEKVENLQINDAEEGLLDILPLVETQLMENSFSAEFDSSTEVSEDPFTTAFSLKYEKQCILSEKLKLPSSDMLVNKDGNQHVNEKMELLQIDGAEEGSLDISPSVEIQLENVISAELDSSTKLSDDPCLLSEKSNLLASENSIFNATIPQGSEVSSMKLNENAISAELDSSIEVSEGPCLLSEKSKLLASENSIFNATIPQGSEVSSVKLNENVISAELDFSIEASDDPCLLSEKSNLLASENSIFNATIPQGSEVSSMKLNENAISAELDSSIEVSEGPCLLSEKSKLLASENSIFNATIPQGSEVSSVKLNENAISAELDSSIEASECPFSSVVAWKSEEQCLLSEKSKLLASNNPTFITTIPQGTEVSSVNSKSLSDVAVTTVFENDKSPNANMLSQTKDNIDFPEDNSKIIHLEIDATKTKQEVPIAKPPLNAAPFTEEWLAAIEAAGEEILTMKSGAVQNSPPDKPQNEPSPWSPVKKNQAIGPFDCTKHNIQSSDPS